MDSEVRNNPDLSRYELFVGKELMGVADYSVAGDAVIIPHTEIDARRRGEGLGAVLVRGVLKDLKASHRSVVPRCWYVAQFIEENPEYRELVAR